MSGLRVGIVAVVALLVVTAAESRAAGPCLTRDGALFCRFGIEVWEDGKRSINRHRWELQCSTSGGKASCVLVTTIFAPLSKDDWLVKEARYASADGGLVLQEARWNEGTLVFDIVHKDGARETVTMRFTKGDAPELTDFTAVAKRRGPSGKPAVEFRIPRETASLDVAILMPGLGPSAPTRDAQPDTAPVEALSVDDQRAYERFRSSGCLDQAMERSDAGLQEAVRDRCGAAVADGATGADPDWDPSEKDLRCMAEAMAGSFKEATRRCLADAGLSAKGQEQALRMMASMFDAETLLQNMQREHPR